MNNNKTFNVKIKGVKTAWGGLTLNLRKKGRLLGGINKPIDVIMSLVLTNEKNMIEDFYPDSKTMENIPDEFILAPDLTSCNYMFSGLYKLKTIDLSNIDTSNITSFRYMFYHCESLTEIDVSSLNTSKVTGFNGAFCYCKALKSLDLTNWDTSNGKQFTQMFTICSELEEIKGVLDISNAGYAYSGMFRDCPKLKQVKIKATPAQQGDFRRVSEINSNTEVIFV